MGIAQDLIDAGYYGYQGWGDAEAAANFSLTGGEGKGGGSGGSSGDSPFNFDYEKEAQAAYGELGAYYDRILKESRGDLTKALARLTEDYDRGIRVKIEDTTLGKDALTLSQAEADRQAKISRQNVVDASLSRGLYRKSAFGEDGGFGIPDTTMKKLDEGIAYSDELRRRQGETLDLGFKRYKEQAGITKSRAEIDLPEEQRRNEYNAEQQRRREAADIANSRGARAYQKFSSQLT